MWFRLSSSGLDCMARDERCGRSGAGDASSPLSLVTVPSRPTTDIRFPKRDKKAFDAMPLPGSSTAVLRLAATAAEGGRLNL
eukprot:scaffold33052_cov107-Isochrysis_galbana.AAC.4